MGIITGWKSATGMEVVRRGWLFYQGTLDPDSGNGWVFRIFNPPSGATPQQINCSVAHPVDTNKWYHIVGTYKDADEQYDVWLRASYQGRSTEEALEQIMLRVGGARHGVDTHDQDRIGERLAAGRAGTSRC